MLSIRGLVIKNGKHALLRNVTMEAGKGTLTLVTGSSGKMNSLLLSAAAGIEKADLGAVLLDGKKVSKKQALLCSGPLSAPVPERKLRRKQLLLLDEPFPGTEKSVRDALLLHLRQLADHGMTILLAAADPAPIAAYADQIALLADGKLCQCAAPEAIYDHPADLFTAQYFSVCNTLCGTVSGVAGDHLRTALDVDGLTLDCPGCKYAEVGDPMTLCIRAEHMHAAFAPVPFGQNLSGTVTKNTFLFGVQEVHVQLPSGQELISIRQQENPVKLTMGERAFLYWDADKSHLFH